MDSFKITSTDEVKELLEAQAHIWNHNSSYLNSMALKCAVHLGIADVIHNHGEPMALTELANSLNIHPSKVHSFPRLMRLLCHNRFFTTQSGPDGETRYGLTTSSRLLVKGHPFSFAPQVYQIQTPVVTEPAHEWNKWFLSGDETPFHIVHGMSLWDYAGLHSEYNEIFNESMASDARLVAGLMAASDKAKGILDGVESLVDVGGGDGTMARAMAKVYPSMKCVVLDLPHVVNGLDGDGLNLVYVAGDMFDSIPHAQVVLLKWILHDWSDEHCVKLLKLCRDAIPRKDKGGKVIIIEIVRSENDDDDNDDESTITKCLFDLQMMTQTVGGKQRTKQEWKNLFQNAGFNDFEFYPILGIRSVIVLYPS